MHNKMININLQSMNVRNICNNWYSNVPVLLSGCSVYRSRIYKTVALIFPVFKNNKNVKLFLRNLFSWLGQL